MIFSSGLMFNFYYFPACKDPNIFMDFKNQQFKIYHLRKTKPVASNILRLNDVLPKGEGAAYHPSHSVPTFISVKKILVFMFKFNTKIIVLSEHRYRHHSSYSIPTFFLTGLLVSRGAKHPSHPPRQCVHLLMRYRH